MYVITNGSSYIYFETNGRVSMTTDINKAKKFKAERQACNLLVNLPKRIQRISNSWKVVSSKSSESVVPRLSITNDNEAQQYVEKLDKLNELIACTQDIVDMIEFIKKHKAICDALQSFYDKKISDIVHIIESSNFNACKGYKYAKMIKENRIQRRLVKNVLIFLQSIESDVGNKIVIMNSKLQKIQNYSYKPRVMKELFEEN